MKYIAKVMGTDEYIVGKKHSIYSQGVDSLKCKDGIIEYIHTDTLKPYVISLIAEFFKRIFESKEKTFFLIISVSLICGYLFGKIVDYILK